MRLPTRLLGWLLAACVLPACSGQATVHTATPTPATAAPQVQPSEGTTGSSTSSATVETDVARDPTPASGTPDVSLSTRYELDALTDVVADPTRHRLFAVEQRGTLVRVDDGSESVALDLSDRTVINGEQGFLSAAFSNDGSFLLAYFTSTRPGEEGDVIIERFSVENDGTIDHNSGRVVLHIDEPYGNHNGGDLEALADGTFLASVGDGGSAGDPERRAHRLDDPLGKLHRFTPLADGSLTIPSDNPFPNATVATLWSSGLRNPWRIDVDPLTGDLWIADVGQSNEEEVNLVPADGGRPVGGFQTDFGWSSREGTQAFNNDVSPDPQMTIVEPAVTYPHSDGACSISGGAVYRGNNIPALWGWYVYADYCNGRVTAFNAANGSLVELGTVDRPTAIERDADGEMWIATASGDLVSVEHP